MFLSLHALTPGFFVGPGGSQWLGRGGSARLLPPPPGGGGQGVAYAEGCPIPYVTRHQSFSTPGPPHWRVYSPAIRRAAGQQRYFDLGGGVEIWPSMCKNVSEMGWPGQIMIKNQLFPHAQEGGVGGNATAFNNRPTMTAAFPTTTRGWCPRCARPQPMRTTKTVTSLPGRPGRGEQCPERT